VEEQWRMVFIDRIMRGALFLVPVRVILKGYWFWRFLEEEYVIRGLTIRGGMLHLQGLKVIL
jgi:hypothetical protein